MEAAVFRKVARRLNGGRLRGSAAVMSNLMGVPIKTVRAWMLDASDPSSRTISKAGSRLTSLLLLLHVSGLLDEATIGAAAKIEELLQGKGGHLDATVALLFEAAENVEDEEDVSDRE